MGMDLYKEMERVCDRITKELHEFNDRLEQNKNIISPIDLENLCRLVEVSKNAKSSMKKIIELDDMLNTGEYSGNYMVQPMWDKRYSGNSYRGTYTMDTGRDGYSGARNMGSRYSRDTEKDNMRGELNDMLRDARDEREADIIRKIMNKL